MKENLKYINHLNEQFIFADEEAYVFENDLHDYSWNIVEKNNRIAGFTRGIVKKTVPVCLHCRDTERGFELRNRLFELTEKDVIAKKPGRLVLSGYYLECYITASKKSEYLYRKRHMSVALELAVEHPFWCRETAASFFPHSGSGTAVGLDYPYDYPCDYTNTVQSDSLLNPGFTASKFRLIIYGACVNPSVAIGEQIYRVNCSVGAGEHLVIDSKNKEIYLANSGGTKINKFKDRYKQSYIFEPIPSGESGLTWDKSFGFDLVLIEERSEPRWI